MPHGWINQEVEKLMSERTPLGEQAHAYVSGNRTASILEGPGMVERQIKERAKQEADMLVRGISAKAQIECAVQIEEIRQRHASHELRPKSSPATQTSTRSYIPSSGTGPSSRPKTESDQTKEVDAILNKNPRSE
jgi:hypothetical protein